MREMSPVFRFTRKYSPLMLKIQLQCLPGLKTWRDRRRLETLEDDSAFLTLVELESEFVQLTQLVSEQTPRRFRIEVPYAYPSPKLQHYETSVNDNTSTKMNSNGTGSRKEGGIDLLGLSLCIF